MYHFGGGFTNKSTKKHLKTRQYMLLVLPHTTEYPPKYEANCQSIYVKLLTKCGGRHNDKMRTTYVIFKQLS